MYDSSYSISDSTDWLNKNHFDYRGLIEKGLAIDATGLNIYWLILSEFDDYEIRFRKVMEK